jgi:hypothetical protein
LSSDPEEPGQLDPGVIRLAIAVMHVTTFFSLLGMGYPAGQALSLTVGIGLGYLTVADWLVTRRRGDGPGSRR